MILNKICVDRADGALKKALRSYEKSFTRTLGDPKCRARAHRDYRLRNAMDQS